MRPGIRSVTLKNIWRDPKTGKTFHRTRRGGKLVLIELPDLPRDHPDFIAAWADQWGRYAMEAATCRTTRCGTTSRTAARTPKGTGTGSGTGSGKRGRGDD